jgi:hypothetical protein
MINPAELYRQCDAEGVVVHLIAPNRLPVDITEEVKALALAQVDCEPENKIPTTES